jgi:streptomycin 6-kinase
MRSTIPTVDAASRRRLTDRFGDEMDAWFGALPNVLLVLAGRWRLEFGAAIGRGSVSVVLRCRTADGRSAVLKVSPDRTRLAFEAAALDGWPTPHTPEVLALDGELGALLLEAIEPGVPLDVSSRYPDVESVAALMDALHRSDVPDGTYPSIGRRYAYVFGASAKLYDRHPGVDAVVPRDLFERGRDLATTLAQDARPPVLVHGDLTPRNILEGGPDRGLVALDPAPCLGDPEFDAVDLLLWLADDVATIVARARQLAGATGMAEARLLDWCRAFAAMNALELATQDGAPTAAIDVLVALANQAPTP